MATSHFYKYHRCLRDTGVHRDAGAIFGPFLSESFPASRTPELVQRWDNSSVRGQREHTGTIPDKDRRGEEHTPAGCTLTTRRC